jgi:5,10-methylenetetrahydromethanopterin reductase
VTAPTIGALIADIHAPAHMLELAVRAEAAGFEEIWVCEDYFLGGGIATAGSVLASVDLPVGLGITPATARHPAVLALELATLAGMFPGRLSAGVGAGVPEFMAQMGACPRSPLTAVADTLKAVRALLRGDVLTAASDAFTADRVVLAHPPGQAPRLFVGAGGPKMLRLSAAHADGTVLSVLSGPRYVKWAHEQLIAGGASSEHRLVVYTLCAIDADVGRVHGMLRDAVASFALSGPRNPLSELQGFADEAEELAGLEHAEAAARIPERWLQELTIAGPSAACAEKIHALGQAGADAVVLCFPSGPAAGEMIDLAGRELLRELVAK